MKTVLTVILMSDQMCAAIVSDQLDKQALLYNALKDILCSFHDGCTVQYCICGEDQHFCSSALEYTPICHKMLQ